MSRVSNSSSTLAPLKLPSNRPTHLLRETVYEVLKGAIVRGTLPPGERLRDGEIAERLDVSRMPVREALRRLADEGLVVAEASRWTKVAPIDVSAAARVYPIIWSLECLAVQLAPAWPDAALQEMRDANLDLEHALAAGDAVAASSADDAFHDVILREAGNPELTTVVHDMKVRIRRIEVAYFGGTTTGERSCREHAAVVDALAAGELTAATEALRLNWSGTLERVLEHGGLDAGDPTQVVSTTPIAERDA